MQPEELAEGLSLDILKLEIAHGGAAPTCRVKKEEVGRAKSCPWLIVGDWNREPARVGVSWTQKGSCVGARQATAVHDNEYDWGMLQEGP